MSKKSPEARARRQARVQQQREEQKRQQRRRQMTTVGAIVLGLVVVVVGGYFVISSLDSTGEDAAAPSGVDGYSIVVGEESAGTTIRIYEDLQCPACAQFEAATADDVSQAVDAGAVKVDYRMVSFLDDASTNDYSSRALNAALVTLDTAGVEAFRELHDTLYAQQPAEGGDGFTDDELVQLAVDAGAEESAVRPGIEDKVYAQWIENATDQMSKDGVNGTPTVFVDGERVEGDPVTAVQEALAGASAS
jgi:protein-disulfide isomerase